MQRQCRMASDRVATDRRREVKRVLVTALVVNLAMTGLKLLIGLLSGSLAVIADAMHSATDALSSLMGLITNGLSDPRPDRDHPYGHDKYEGVGALAIAGFILFTAIEILIKGSERILEGIPQLRVNSIELLLLLVVLVFNLGLAFYERREGRRLQSQLLLADARHTTADIWDNGDRAVGPHRCLVVSVQLAGRSLGASSRPVADQGVLAGHQKQFALAGRPHRHRAGGHS